MGVITRLKTAFASAPEPAPEPETPGPAECDHDEDECCESCMTDTERMYWERQRTTAENQARRHSPRETDHSRGAL